MNGGEDGTKSGDGAAVALPPRSRDVLLRALRRLSITGRIVLVVVVNLVALVALGAVLWSGGGALRDAWSDLRGAHATTARLTDLERTAYRLHREVRSFLDRPDENHRNEVEEAKSEFTRALWSAEDESGGAAREDVHAFAEIARHYLFGFDDLRGLEIDIALLYDNEFSDLEGAMRANLDALDLAIRPGDALLRPLVTSAYDRFAEIRIQLHAYRRDRDHTRLKAARGARDVFVARIDWIGLSPSPDSRGYAVEMFRPQIAELDGIFARLTEIADKQARWLADLVESNRTAMLDALVKAVEGQHRREDAAIEDFDAMLRTSAGRFLAIAAGLLAVSLFVSLQIARSIRVPLADVRASLASVMAGQSDRPIDGLDQSDEIGTTARSVERFRVELVGFQRRQEELASLERRWLSVLEASPIGISVRAADDRRVLFRNGWWRKLFLLGDDDWDRDVMPGGAGFASRDDIARIEAGLARGETAGGRLCEMSRSDGERWWATVEARPIEFAGVAAHIMWIYDVTDRRLAEEELRSAKERAEAAFANLAEAQRSLVEAEKLAAIGGLVAGVAHEVNNPVGIGLTVATSFAARVAAFEAELKAGPIRRSRLDEFVALAADAAHQLTANLQRAGDLVQSFKQVAVDRTHPDRRLFDLAEATEQIAASLRPSLKTTRLLFDVDMAPGISVEGYPGAWGQVLTNLFMNAQMHAFPKGSAGTMTVRARPLPEGRVEIVFADDGAGMAPDVARRAFEPFFTTRRGSGGSGLGLHIVYNIVVHRLGGRVRVVTAPGEGCRIVMDLPLVAPQDDDVTGERSS